MRHYGSAAHSRLPPGIAAGGRDRADTIRRGYRIVWEPPILRHFQARLAPIED